ncbi:MAG: hypothetical protein ACTSV1_03585 [Alphaproteobacteria bacterium]
MTARHPRSFFDEHVRPSFEDWLRDELCEWKAKATITNLDIMAETCFVYWQSTEPEKLADAGSPRQYREYLRRSECEDFGLVWDIHDAHKHVSLDSSRVGGREVKRSDQTEVSSLGWGEARWGRSRLGSPTELVVTTDNGAKVSLVVVGRNVFDMWNRLLENWEL